MAYAPWNLATARSLVLVDSAKWEGAVRARPAFKLGHLRLHLVAPAFNLGNLLQLGGW